MKNSIFISVLLLIGVTLSHSQTLDGTIPFDCPDVPRATFQFNFNRELIALISTTEPFNTIENLYIHTYDAKEGLPILKVEIRSQTKGQGISQNVFL